jgi:hypothetical protein
VDLTNGKRTANIENDVYKPSRNGNCNDDNIPLPDGNAVSGGKSYKPFVLEDIHMDSHAENDKGRGKNESEIGKELEQRTS